MPPVIPIIRWKNFVKKLSSTTGMVRIAEGLLLSARRRYQSVFRANSNDFLAMCDPSSHEQTDPPAILSNAAQPFGKQVFLSREIKQNICCNGGMSTQGLQGSHKVPGLALSKQRWAGWLGAWKSFETTILFKTSANACLSKSKGFLKCFGAVM